MSLIGLVSSGQLLRATPYAVLGMFVAGAVLTPPDPVSQVFLAVPLLLLYLLGVGVAWIFDTRRKASKESSEEPEATPPT